MRKENKYWQNKENCRLEAIKYQTRNLFSRKCSQGYHMARINGWLEEICQHMIRIGNRYNKCIYVCEFSDNFAYIGLTYNFKERNNAHLNIKGKKFSSVTKHIIETTLIPKIIKLTDYININEAIILEEKFLNFYFKNGWQILNKIKTGGIGGKPKIWTKENCEKEALKYNSRYEFQVKSSGAYDSACKNGWLNDITKHMLIYRKYRNYWTKENCQIEAFKYKKISDFRKKSGSAYMTAFRNGWLNNIYLIQVHEHQNIIN